MIRNFILAGALSLALMGCATAPSTSPVQSAVTVAEQTLTSAHQVHDFFAKEADSLHAQGVLVGDNAKTVAVALAKSEAILVQADADFAVGKDIANEVSAASSLLTTVTPLITGSK